MLAVLDFPWVVDTLVRPLMMGARRPELVLVMVVSTGLVGVAFFFRLNSKLMKPIPVNVRSMETVVSRKINEIIAN